MKRTPEYQEQVEDLRDDLHSILNVNDTPTLEKFAKEAYAFGKTFDPPAWNKHKQEGGEWKSALKSLHYLLGGGGCMIRAQESFRYVHDAWVASGRVTPKRHIESEHVNVNVNGTAPSKTDLEYLGKMLDEILPADFPRAEFVRITFALYDRLSS